MKLLSDASEYALRAVVWLAQRPGEAQKVRQIAEGTQSAPGYLVKVLQSLTKAGILSAQRGSHGGFTLMRDPDELTALEVINVVDPVERIKTCPLGLEAHGDCLCPMHRRMDDALANFEESFGASTIAELIDDGSSPSRPLCSALTINGAAPDPK
jgi:Rrf2 family nitric oxide-sensitive transcriptional repressor